MHKVPSLAIALIILMSCKKTNEQLPEFYVAMNVNNERIVLTMTEGVVEESPLLFSFSARDSSGLHRINFTLTNVTPGVYPQFTDTTQAPDFSQSLWLDCSYITGGNWYYLRPIAGKHAGTLTIASVDQNIVSGSFYAWIGTSGNALQLTDGNFRIQIP